MKTITFLILMFMLTATDIFSQTTAPPLETGVSQSLAKWRAANYSDVRYKLNITLEKGAPLMKGEIEVSVKLTETGAKNDLVLDWRTTQFANDKDKPFAEVEKVNGQIVKETVQNGVFDYQINKEHLVISKKYLKTGENVLQIKFASPIKTSGSAITRYVDKEDGAEYIYSLFVPSDASTAFPVFDQPDLKARFQLTVNKPNDWTVITNALGETSEVVYSDPTKSREFITKFVETPPISSYVFAFAAGPFERFDIPDKPTTNTKVRSEIKETYKKWLSNDVSISISSEVAARMEKEKLEKLSKGFASDTRDFLHIYVRKSQAEKFKQHSAEVFRLNREGVKFLESYFDYKFPFPKYDLVLIPEFPFGGMEHAGATFLRETSVIFPTEPTKNDYVSRANLIFHEAAHQWFGDTVTMKWFDDLWLKEGFAEFMAYKTLEKVMPEYNAWKIFYERNKQAAYLTDSTRGTTPIYQEIPNLSAAKSAYGNIVYRKAPSFLKQAEFYLGEKEFQTAVRAFLKKHEFANAEWTDLVKEFETVSKQDLKEWADIWVKQSGVNKIRFEVMKGKILANLSTSHLAFAFGENKVSDKKSETLFSIMKFKVLYENEDNTRQSEEFTIESRSHSMLTFNGEPKFIFPNYQDYGYGIFLLDEQSRDYVLQNIQNEKDDFLRSMMWGSLWDSVREGELDPQEYVELVIKNLELSEKSIRPTGVAPIPDGKPPVFPETDVGTINTLLNRVGTAMNYYLSEDQRKELAPRLEDVLYNKIVMPLTPKDERITAFRAYLNLASTAKSRLALKGFLNDDKRKPLNSELSELQKFFELSPLKTKDRFDIITKLLILGDEDAPKLLAELEKTETSDEAKRYAYAAKAGIGTAENKLKFWNDFVANKEISESWIESAFASFNSSRHSELTLPYLEKALAELPNLKRNRKIFFVNGWLSAFIGGQKSEEALNIINKFLADNPNLDKDLRLKILENSDALERAVKIRNKYR